MFIIVLNQNPILDKTGSFSIGENPLKNQT